MFSLQLSRRDALRRQHWSNTTNATSIARSFGFTKTVGKVVHHYLPVGGVLHIKNPGIPNRMPRQTCGVSSKRFQPRLRAFNSANTSP